MVKITGTLVWYYFVCKRQVWMMSREMNPYNDDELLELGRLIHEHFYKREKKEISFSTMRLDLVKKNGKNTIVGEIKKSSRYLLPGQMQLAFYLYQLKQRGIEASGELLVPKERKKEKILLTEELEKKLKNAMDEIQKIIRLDAPPPVVKTRFCSKCAYKDLCFA